jgi:hypothetical protein
MKLDWAALLTPTYLIGGVTVLIIIGLSVAGIQKSCGKRHEGAAQVEGIKADASAERLKDALQQVKGLQERTAQLEADGRRYKTLYEQAKRNVQPVPSKPPANPSELTAALEQVGFHLGVRIEHDALSSVLTEQDAGLVWLLSKRTERLEQIEAALAACDLLQSQQELTLKAKDEVILKTNEALKASMSEAMHRQAQADELGKALKVEKRKGWQRVGAFGLGVLGGYLAGKK